MTTMGSQRRSLISANLSVVEKLSSELSSSAAALPRFLSLYDVLEHTAHVQETQLISSM